MASSKTVTSYRLVAPRWASTALSGEGARLYGGRWNSPGRPMVYLGGSRALAALELLVHLPTPLSREKPYVLIGADVPTAAFQVVPEGALPNDWRISPPGREAQALGDAWLESEESLGLWVPSAIIPEESNLLLNPRHPAMSKVRLGEPSPFRLDPRLVTNPSPA